MKRSFTLLIAVIELLFCITLLFGCKQEGAENLPQLGCLHDYVLTDTTVSCTEAGTTTYKCSLCEYTYTKQEEALGHTVAEGNCGRCGLKIEKKAWKIAYYLDEFNNVTKESYVTNLEYFVGSFTDAEATNAKLYARVLIDNNNVSINLWKEGKTELKGCVTTEYSVTILDGKGEKHYIDGTLYKNSNYVVFDNEPFITLLKNNDTLKIYMEENLEEDYNATYLFTIKKGDFDSVFSQYSDLRK